MLAHSAATQIAFLPYNPYVLSLAKLSAPYVLPLKAEQRVSQVLSVAVLCRSKASQDRQEKMWFCKEHVFSIPVIVKKPKLSSHLCPSPQHNQSLSPGYDPDGFLHLRMQ